MIGRAAVFWVKCSSSTLRSAAFLTKSSAFGRSPSSGSLVNAPCISRLTFFSLSQCGRTTLRLDQEKSAMPCTSPRSIARAISAVLLYPVTTLNFVPSRELYSLGVVSGSTPAIPPTIISLSSKSFAVRCVEVAFHASVTAVSLLRLANQRNLSISKRALLG